MLVCSHSQGSRRSLEAPKFVGVNCWFFQWACLEIGYIVRQLNEFRSLVGLIIQSSERVEAYSFERIGDLRKNYSFGNTTDPATLFLAARFFKTNSEFYSF